MRFNYMFFPKSFCMVMSPVLALALVLMGLPMSTLAAEPDLPVGSVSVTGTVQLRGVPIAREGSLFSGDTVRTEDEAYARVMLSDGPQFELGSQTDVTVDVADDSVRVGMESGLLAFSSPSTPLSINVESYEIVASQGSKGNVALLEQNQLGIHASEGSLTVRNLDNGEVFVLAENRLNQQDGDIIILDGTEPGTGVPMGVWLGLITAGVVIPVVIFATKKGSPN